MTYAVKPLACPFCGGPAEAQSYIVEAAISCRNCHVALIIKHSPAMEDGLLKAITAWNRRTPPAGWKPIETAPKDGTRILMWDAEFTEWKIVQWDIGEPSILCGDEKYWVTDSEGPNPDNHIVENPKYWMPLPAAPENDDE